MKFLPKKYPLVELHIHVGGSVSPAIMWGIAHEQGIRLPTKDYWAFKRMITVRAGVIHTLSDYLKLFHLTELIQSSPVAMERSVYEIIGGGYRSNNVVQVELRYNPMKRNRGGERDLDHIIMASIRGLDRAMLEYPVQAGLILCLDRGFSATQNAIIVDKAIRYRERGVVGIDIAGPKTDSFRFQSLAPMIADAKKAGLGVTIHTGEETGVDEMWEVMNYLHPHRIGHGVKAAWDEHLMGYLRETGTVLEICPSSNLQTGAIRNIDEMRFVLQTFLSHGVRFSLNTDGPDMLLTSIRKEMALLLRHGILNLQQLEDTNTWARESSFLTSRILP
ncbi:MAG: adenosine deaminase [Chloroflexi bacterium]|nr:adenosine deaminase [Chloroflexota bacterium]